MTVLIMGQLPPNVCPECRASDHLEERHLAVRHILAGRHQQAEAALYGQRRPLLARLAHGHRHPARRVAAQLEAALVAGHRRERSLKHTVRQLSQL